METTQPAVSPEDQLTAVFEKAGYRDDPEPDEGEDNVAEPETEEPAASTDEESEAPEETEESDADAQPETTDSEEVEYDGEVYKLPAKLKDALLRHQDYTRKTQEVAIQKRTVDEQAKSLQLHAQFQKEHFAKAVEAQSLQARLQQFGQVNWAELAESNPAQYLQLDRQHRELQEAAHRVTSEMRQLQGEFQGKTVEARQKAQALCIEEVRKEFGKSFGPEFLRELDDTAKGFGFTGEELAEVTDPRMIRVLHAATQYKRLQASKSLVAKKVQEAKPVQLKAARSAQTSHQTVQLNAARDRVKSTGKASDAVSFLAARFAKSMR